jgi:hypothetical protein
MEDSDWLCSSNGLVFICNSCNESDTGENYYFFKENVPLQNVALGEEF